VLAPTQVGALERHNFSGAWKPPLSGPGRHPATKGVSPPAAARRPDRHRAGQNHQRIPKSPFGWLPRQVGLRSSDTNLFATWTPRASALNSTTPPQSWLLPWAAAAGAAACPGGPRPAGAIRGGGWRCRLAHATRARTVCGSPREPVGLERPPRLSKLARPDRVRSSNAQMGALKPTRFWQTWPPRRVQRHGPRRRQIRSSLFGPPNLGGPFHKANRRWGARDSDPHPRTDRAGAWNRPAEGSAGLLNATVRGNLNQRKHASASFDSTPVCGRGARTATNFSGPGGRHLSWGWLTATQAQGLSPPAQKDRRHPALTAHRRLGGGNNQGYRRSLARLHPRWAR